MQPASLISLTPARAGVALLHTFDGSGNDGAYPQGSLTLSGSKLYGMTYFGGSGTSGTLFSMNSDGTGFGLLHSFAGDASDARYPVGSLTLSGSKFYGVTSTGGSSITGGTLFSVNTDGSGFGLVHSFDGSASGSGFPSGSLALSDSKLYGMTHNGGSSGAGAVFSMNTDGTGFGLLHSFTGGSSDGGSPNGSLKLSGSKLYGVATLSSNSDAGAVFSMNTDGTGFGLLHSFVDYASDGINPLGSLTLSGSKLYGVTSVGGSSGAGEVFSMNTDGTGFGLVHSFDGSASGSGTPSGSLAISGSKLYGMTAAGGATGSGAVFSVNTDGTGFGLVQSLDGVPWQGTSFGDVILSDDGSTLYGMTSQGGTAFQGVIFSVDISGVPEPATVAVGLLCLGVGMARRRRSAGWPE